MTGTGDGAARRDFLRGAAVSGAGGLLLGGLTGAAAVSAAEAAPRAQAATTPPYHGRHQPGVVPEPRRHTILVAFDVIADGRAELTDLMRTLTDRARVLSAGGPPRETGISGPPADSGVLGAVPPRHAGPLITVGVGASLFDDRYGLAARRPAGLTTMEAFPNDTLDPKWCHGDLSVQLSADDEDTVLHALRDIARHTRGAMQVRWRMSGFVSPPRPSGTPRNLMGFKDGTANPAGAELERLVWLGGSGPLAGGTYLAVRLIRMLVEFWDRIGVTEQEQLIGRSRDSGAPLDGTRESDPPHYARDPVGKLIPLTSHIRRANPRTPKTDRNRILRRSFNYDLGTDASGNLDMGLLFTCYQRDLRTQFETVQGRLKDEPLVDYITPFGGGYFLVLPGVRDPADHLGRALLT